MPGWLQFAWGHVIGNSALLSLPEVWTRIMWSPTGAECDNTLLTLNSRPTNATLKVVQNPVLRTVLRFTKRTGNQWHCPELLAWPWQQNHRGAVTGGWLCVWRGACVSESRSWSSEALVVDTECEEAGTAEGLHGSQGTGLSSAPLTAAALKRPRDDCSSLRARSAETRRLRNIPQRTGRPHHKEGPGPMSRQLPALSSRWVLMGLAF